MKRCGSLVVTILVTITMVWVLSGCGQNHDDRNGHAGEDKQEKLVVLTFDDAVKSHLTVVAPLLKESGFKATFFVTYAFMEDTANFLTWHEIAELHKMGFEIGNHSWTHPDFAQPFNAARMAGEIGLVNYQLSTVGVPQPVSFAWTGNGFGPEAVHILEEQGIRFARRGMQPEIPYGSMKSGPVYDPRKNHPLLIPTTRDAYPEMKLADFVDAVESAGPGEIPVLQFHGVPDKAHPWVHTDPTLFKECMKYLKENDFKVIALKDIESLIPDEIPEDPLLYHRYVLGDSDELRWSDEVMASREDPGFWLSNMVRHNYSLNEMQAVLGWPEEKIDNILNDFDWEPLTDREDRITVLPYPGGRHPRIGFREGMLSPMRGTKASIFLPWDPDQYLVLDLPEAVFTQFGLTFLGHKHIPTIFDQKKIKIKNRDWKVHDDGRLTNRWDLPNRMTIGAGIFPGEEEVNMELWVHNGTGDTSFTDLQTQICIMLKGVDYLNERTNENKVFESPVVAVKGRGNDYWVLTAWDRCTHAWGNADCPCMHSDPAFPPCPPGDTVRVSGKLWFYRGERIEEEISTFNNERFTVTGW